MQLAGVNQIKPPLTFDRIVKGGEFFILSLSDAAIVERSIVAVKH